MVTLKGKDADRFIRKMIKKQNSPISKQDRKLARDIEETMSKVVESDEDRRRRELEEKYNPTIPKVDDGLCSRCRKNKATINYTDSIMSYTHGFIERICQECYDKMKHENNWYKAGRKEVLKEVEKILDEYDTNDWKKESFHTINMEIKQRIKKLRLKDNKNGTRV
jgi:hypothetical protein